MISLTELPDEILLEILAKLPGNFEGLRSLLNAGETCRRLHQMSRDDRLYGKYKDNLCEGFPIEGSCRRAVKILFVSRQLKEKLGLEESLSNFFERKELSISRFPPWRGKPIEHCGIQNWLEDWNDDDRSRELLKEIGRLNNLQELSIRLPLERFPEEFLRLENLKNLNLCQNGLKILPEDIYRLRNLQKLRVSSNVLEKIPRNIGNLINLRELDLEDNLLRKLPKEICQLVGLRKLFLSDNQLEELPKGIDRLNNLRELHIEWNPLRDIPEEINSLAGLRYLCIDEMYVSCVERKPYLMIDDV